MKRILGLDLGTNSIGWAVIQQNFKEKTGNIIDAGTRIIPMSQDIINNFGSGQSISQTAERTQYRSIRRLYQRDNLRRDRLHRVLNILGFLPKHYSENIDFDKHKGQFIKEVKLNYKPNSEGKHEFIFEQSFQEMVAEFKASGYKGPIPYDWTLYYLRVKALSKKISPQELAWLILHFNQKRGYYQLRGEDEQEDNSKAYLILTVVEIKDSGEKINNTDDKLYDIYFENGWKYDKQTTKPENWKGQSKEFIVTTKTLKDGSIKRTYKSVDAEKDWIAIKKKTEQDIEASDMTVGQYIFNSLLVNPQQKIRGELIKTIERKFYKEELHRILNFQSTQHPELKDKKLLEACALELYPKNDALRNLLMTKDFVHLFLEDIIFYQRPLKSKKSSIGDCQYEYTNYKRVDKKTGELIRAKSFLKAIPKSHPLFIEFRMWQFLHNLKFYRVDDKANIDITEDWMASVEDWCDLFDELMSRTEADQNTVLNYFIKKKKITKAEKENYRWNYQEDKKFPMNDTGASILNRLKKVEGFEEKKWNKDFEKSLWHIIYSVRDKVDFGKALKTFAQKNNLDTESMYSQFIKYPPYSSDYGSYSHKAITKLIPLMRMGRYWKLDDVDTDAIKLIDNITERVKNVQVSPDKVVSEKKLKEAIHAVSDDTIPSRFVKSFLNRKGLNPYSGLNTYQAGYAVYRRHSENEIITRWISPQDIDDYIRHFKQHSLRNPIVEQVVLETLRTVRDIWDQVGEGSEKFFDEIHVELGRDLKNSKDKRKRISEQQSDRERTNLRIKELLKELNEEYSDVDIRSYSPSHQEILKLYEEGVWENPDARYKSNEEKKAIESIRMKNNPTKKDIQRYKLWLEQGYISPYTGQVIPLSKLFTEDYQIEHIIPQALYFDDSLSNKVICESAVNAEKDKKTAYAFIDARGGEVINLGQNKNVTLLTLKQYEEHCSKYFKNNKAKLRKLLSEEVPDGFIDRQMNDSRYISKMVKNLLSNVVREPNEREAVSKNLLPIPGSVTAKLRNDWGIDDKWNELIAPRFERLNEMTNSKDFGYWDDEINAYRSMVPDEYGKNFSKKRIDHRHHEGDAIVIACATRDHTHYLNALNAENKNHSLRDKLLIKNKQGHYTKTFQLPWQKFPTDVHSTLENTVVSFKKNLRVINKTNNKTWQWVKTKSGKNKKKLVPQTKGDNWAIRKPLHKETVAGKVVLPQVAKNKLATAYRVALTDKLTRKQLNKITDTGIQKILNNHVARYLDEKGKEDFASAFSPEGIIKLNQDIIELNNGKFHHPIYKVRVYEEGSKFPVSENPDSAKHSKYVEAAKGTNLYFAVYWDEKKNTRNFVTVPLHEVIQHQKDVAHMPTDQRTEIQADASKGRFLYTLSPNDLVYLPTEEELQNPELVDKNNLSPHQHQRIYKMVSANKKQCFFIPIAVATSIANKLEFTSSNKMERAITGEMIKESCWKLKVNRLGKIEKIIR